MMKRRFSLLLTFALVFHGLAAPARERWLFLGDSITQAGHYVDYIETWFLLHEADAPEIIDLGLGSETVSGLSEPGHPFPRPCLLPRLDRVLERVKPDVVIACYGMNCGIYHPFSDERFEAYKTGINKLVADAQAIGAKVILLTPPPFAGRVQPRTPPAEGENFGFKTPSADYNEVLAKYGDWILSLNGKNGIRAFTIRPPLEKFMEQCYLKEPVHPNTYGHELMGEAFLQSLGKQTGSDLLDTGVSPHSDDAQWNKLIGLVEQQRLTYDRALLNDVGHGNPGVMKKNNLTLAEAEEQVKAIDAEIKRVVLVNPQH
jgi:lysophospholipase L1-like esterase